MLQSIRFDTLGVETQRETMVHTSSHFGSESKSWDPLITIVIEENVRNCVYCHLVLIWSIWVHVVQ